jgi:hypothetical protein
MMIFSTGIPSAMLAIAALSAGRAVVMAAGATLAPTYKQH